MKAVDTRSHHEKRYRTVVHRNTHYRRDQGERLAASKRLFGRRVHAVDIHSHSTHSDGVGTIAENYEAAMRVGLDFVFGTDHNSLRQKRSIACRPRMSWGQEPGADIHHIGLLCNTRRFTPKRDSIAADFARAQRLSPFVFVPHPVGWYPKTWYSDEAIEALWSLPTRFAMEVLNGALKHVRAYDAFDAKAVRVWDRLLCDGFCVTALGGSDAHAPEDFGNAWTGVFARECAAPTLIRAMGKSACFASEGPFVEFRINGRQMGATVRVSAGTTLRFTIRAADAAGIALVRMVSNGRVLKTWAGAGRESTFSTAFSRNAVRIPGYYRVEVIATDDRRAFSSPVYVR